MIRRNIYNDPMIKGLLERIPKDERDLFSEEQLIILKSAMGAKQWGSHAVDMRWTLKFWHYRYYFVFLSGRNRRPLGRRAQELELFGTTVLMLALLVISMLSGLLLLYLAKSALGIDIIPGFSLGIWGSFKDDFF